MPTLSDEELISMGEELYVDHCATCHQEGGEGTGNFPMLDGNPFVTQDPDRPIRQVINGQGAMPGFGSSLSSEEIAAIVSYIRNAWTNNASVVMPDQVQQVR
jgi:cytochrome c oxidase subunit 2